MLGLIIATALTAPAVDCRFDVASMQFAGSPQDQARCLLRHVQPGGAADQMQPLPPTLAGLIGRPVLIDRSKLAAVLRHARIPLPVGTPVSETSEHLRARYFVIHDTSSPWIGDKPFPNGFDRIDRFNDVTQFLGKDAVAHLFNDRRGRITVGHDLEVGWRATKFERALGDPSRGLFLHVENVQPRREDPAGPPHNDLIGPEPGFTAAQYRSLALVYVLASARAGTWLIPALHANIDRGILQAHDDPQHFDVGQLDGELARWLRRLSVRTYAEPTSSHLTNSLAGCAPRPKAPCRGER